MRLVAAVFLAIVCVASAAFPLFAQAPPAKTVWSGVYSDAQAVRGEAEYVSKCASCHKEDLSGYQSILKGDRFMNEYREATLYRLFDKMKTTMPRGAAGSLTDHQYIDIVSFVLKSNDFPAGGEELKAEDLQGVSVVGKGGSEPVPDFSLVQIVGCLVHNDSNDTWVVTNASEPVRATHPQGEAEELKAATAKPLGSGTVELMTSASHDPLSHKGHKVDARGFLIRRPAGNRINITGLETVAPDCGR
jgi:mono/diheme cytochrome c family protein